MVEKPHSYLTLIARETTAMATVVGILTTLGNTGIESNHKSRSINNHGKQRGNRWRPSNVNSVTNVRIEPVRTHPGNYNCQAVREPHSNDGQVSFKRSNYIPPNGRQAPADE